MAKHVVPRSASPNVSLRNIARLALAGTVALLMAFAAVALSTDPADAQVAPSGVACNASGGSGGLTPGEHNVTIAGQQVLVYVGDGYSSSRPAMLAFYLHGDGAGDRTFMSSQRRDLMDNNGWIYVAPRSFETRWWSSGVSSTVSGNAGIEANAQLLENVFEQMFTDYNLCRDVLLGSSASGGSWFYDAYFLPTRGAQYPAYMNIGCGSSGINAGWAGFPFYDDLLSITTSPDILARTKLHYSIGTEDFLFQFAEVAAPHLQSLGFDVTTDYRPGVLHCAYDVDVTAVNWWADLCANGFVPTTSTTTSGAARPESCNPNQVSGPTPTPNPTPSEATCRGVAVTINMNTNGGDGIGSAGDDVILGTPGADVIRGGDGDDIICAGDGDDTVYGGSGEDRIFGDGDADTLFGGVGNDRINGGAGDDVIRGRDGADRLFGNQGNDAIYGGGDDDLIVGKDGDDTLRGGDGDDVMKGGFGRDSVYGGNGNDNIQGGDGNDDLRGEAGDDKVKGQNGADTALGGSGNDIVKGGNGIDVVDGQSGDDQVWGKGDNDTVIGGAGNDTLKGGKGSDSLDGGQGTDTCDAGGGPGSDSFAACETQTQ